MKLACAVALLFTVTVQVAALPVHAPDQFTKVKPGSGVAVKVTAVPAATLAAQLLPQLIPPGRW